MSVKGQLIACRDALMAGMRATSRLSTPNDKAEKLLRACLDLVEPLAGQSLAVTAAEVETTLSVLENAYAELESEQAPATAALKNAIGRLRALRLEITAK